MGKRILVAFDDSENAMRAVEFVAQSFTPDHEITLFSVIADTAAFCDMNSPELTPHFLSQQNSFCLLEDKKRELVQAARKEAKALLVKAGFQEDRISLKMETKKKGVARDIADEAHSGYDTVVMGRRGLSGIKEFLLGGISQKVLHLLREMSVVLVK
jgi:nucleotide-binding universal stress UspA family protein